MLRFAPGLILFLLLAPLLAGLAGTALPALGYLPGLDGDLAFDPLAEVAATPGFSSALAVTLISGFASTLIALIFSLLLLASFHNSRFLGFLRSALAPLLAVPHLAAALGFFFLFSPSGWIARLFSFGASTPPAVVSVQDPWGLSLALGLSLKEAPFLFMMGLAALNQVKVEPQLRIARALGYRPLAAWIKVILPQVYPQLRLPLFAVLAFGLGNVDMATVLGPTTPPSLATLVLHWAQDPELTRLSLAAAGGLLLALIMLAAIGLWLIAERILARVFAPHLSSGKRQLGEGPLKFLARAFWLFLIAALFCGAVGQLLWSLAESWRFPDLLPSSFSDRAWSRLPSLFASTGRALVIALIVLALALPLALAALENEQRRGLKPARAMLWLLYLPLILPQASFLFGLQIWLVALDLDGAWVSVVLAHFLFVFPYLYLALADPYRALDPRYRRAGSALGQGPFATWWRIVLPLLLRPILLASALGFAVSVNQYLATLFPGGGRITTLMTEAMAEAGGGDRRQMGLYATLLGLLPLLVFALALLMPAWLFRRRAGMKVGA